MRQQFRRWIAQMIVAALCAGCGASPVSLPGVGNVPAAFNLPNGDAQVAFQLHGNYVVLDVNINGKGPYKFLLDTGAGATVISPALADALPQNILGTTSIVSNVDTNSVQTQFILVDRLDLGPMSFEKFQAAVLPPLSITSRGQTIEIEGLVGAPIFRNLALTVNYPGRVLRVRDQALPATDDCKVLPVQIGEGELSFLTLDVAGRNVQAVVDTGNNEFLVLPSGFSNLPFSGPTQTSSASTVTGTIATIKGALDGSVTAGCITYTNPTVTIGGGIASMGGRAFLDYSITLDQSTHRFWFQQ